MADTTEWNPLDWLSGRERDQILLFRSLPDGNRPGCGCPLCEKPIRGSQGQGISGSLVLVGMIGLIYLTPQRSRDTHLFNVLEIEIYVLVRTRNVS